MVVVIATYYHGLLLANIHIHVCMYIYMSVLNLSLFIVCLLSALQFYTVIYICEVTSVRFSEAAKRFL